MRRLAAEDIVEQGLLGRAPPRPGDGQLVRLASGIAAAASSITLKQTAAQLVATRKRMPRGGTRWYPSSVRNLLRPTERFGFWKSGPHSPATEAPGIQAGA